MFSGFWTPKFLDFTDPFGVLPIVKVLPLSGTRSRAMYGSDIAAGIGKYYWQLIERPRI
jgi:hypothetical protein